MSLETKGRIYAGISAFIGIYMYNAIDSPLQLASFIPLGLYCIWCFKHYDELNNRSMKYRILDFGIAFLAFFVLVIKTLMKWR